MANRTPHDDRLTDWVREHAPAVHGLLFAMLGDRHAADDLVQEVFCRAWESRERYVEQGKPRAYLLRIADRMACDHLRRRRERPVDDASWQQIEPLVGDKPPLAQLLQAESRQQLDQALATLSDLQRRALLLRYYSDLDFSEVAQILDCPLNTALSHARRGLQALRRLLVEKLP